jgi:hypothetical protein
VGGERLTTMSARSAAAAAAVGYNPVAFSTGPVLPTPSALTLDHETSFMAPRSNRDTGTTLSICIRSGFCRSTVLSLVLPLLTMLAGCGASVKSVQQDLRAAVAQGDFATAQRVLAAPESVQAYGDRSRLLWELESGAVAIGLDSPETAIAHLDAAENTAGYNYDPSTADVLAKWTLNDSAASFRAQPYIDMYINSFKMLSYMERGQLDGYATAEADKHMRKAEYLRGMYQQYMQDLTGSKNGSGEFVQEGLKRAQLDTTSEGNFVESPLGTFVSTVVFMKTGDRQSQQVATRRLLSSIAEQQKFIGPVALDPFRPLETMSRSEANFLAVALVGSAPEIVARKLPLPIGGRQYEIPFPQLKAYPASVVRAFVEVEGEPLRPMELIEDMGAVASENYRRSESAIYARTLIRIGVKVGIVVGGTYAVSQTTENDFWTGVTAVGGGVAVWASEEADLRTWTTMPGQAHVLLCRLPQSESRVRLVYDLAGGGRTTTQWRSVKLSSDGLTTVVER